MKKLSEILRTRNKELAEKYALKAAGKEYDNDSISTGLPSLDSKGLLEKGILTIIAGDPGAGKTAWALHLLESAVGQGYSPIGFFFEDPFKFLADRITSKSMGESAFDLRRIQVSSSDVGKRIEAVEREESWTESVTVDDQLRPVGELLRLCGDFIEDSKEETGVVLVDYAQAFDAEEDEKSVERVIARLAWGLSALAKKYNVAVVLFSQIKKEVSDRGKKWFESWTWNRRKSGESEALGPTDVEAVEGFRPLSNDLQWSTSLQQRAKQILFIFRPYYWLRQYGVNCPDNRMQVMIAKGNYGPNMEMCQFEWNGALGSIKELKKRALK